jgi:hypothetical protein
MATKAQPARWPEMMTQRDAAEYCGLSIAKFESQVLSGCLPMPVLIGGVERWRKHSVDKALDVMSGEADTTGEQADYRKRMRDRHARKQA